jgi:hypothetical protein
MIKRALSALFASALLFPQLTGCVVDKEVEDAELVDSDSNVTNDEEVGSAASAVESKPARFIIRHGETTDGTNITAAGKTALQNAWGSVACSLINQAELVYLYSDNDVTGSERYYQTRTIVKDKLNANCPTAAVIALKLTVADLSSFTASQAQTVYNSITKISTKPRIFVLGSFLLHKLTQDSDCSLPDKTDCYLKDWAPFMSMWNASRNLDECLLGNDPNDRRFMYNFIYRFNPTDTAGQDVAHSTCVGWKRIPLNTYASSASGTCSAQWDALKNLPTGCSW